LQQISTCSKQNTAIIKVQESVCTATEYTCGKDKGNGKGTLHPKTGHKGSDVEQRYNSTLSLT
jgi:hypothetical protein